jgi:hypothetical protein
MTHQIPLQPRFQQACFILRHGEGINYLFQHKGIVQGKRLNNIYISMLIRC